jgi:hypothetical protein
MMKRFLFAAVIFLGVVLVPLFCFAASCDSEGSSYYIRFTLDGTAYDFTKGTTDIEAAAFGNILTQGPWVFMGGTSEEVSSEEEPDNGIMILINGTTADTYSLDPTDEETMFMVIVNGVGYNQESGSVIVTAVGEVGGAIEGTFSGTVEGAETSVSLTDGSFRVKRITDDRYMPPID